MDPLTKSYPWYTPYQFAGNKPIFALDLDGAEEIPYFKEFSYNKNIPLNVVKIVPNAATKIVNGSISFVNGGFSILNELAFNQNSEKDLLSDLKAMPQNAKGNIRAIATAPITLTDFVNPDIYANTLSLAPIFFGFNIKTSTANTVSEFETMYRVQGGGSKQRFVINNNSLAIEGEDMLFVNIGDKSRALEFVAKRGDDAVILKFNVNKSFIEKIKNDAIEQRLGRFNPDKPQIVDPTKASDQYGIPSNYFHELLENIDPKSIEVVTKP